MPPPLLHHPLRNVVGLIRSGASIATLMDVQPLPDSSAVAASALPFGSSAAPFKSLLPTAALKGRCSALPLVAYAGDDPHQEGTRVCNSRRRLQRPSNFGPCMRRHLVQVLGYLERRRFPPPAPPPKRRYAPSLNRRLVDPLWSPHSYADAGPAATRRLNGRSGCTSLRELRCVLRKETLRSIMKRYA